MSLDSLKILLVVFFTLIVGIIFIQVIADSETKFDFLETITDDQDTVVNATCTRITTGCIDTLTSVENATGTRTIAAANYTLCRSSTGYQDGIKANILDNTATDPGLLWNFTYTQSADCTYIKNSTSKALLSLLVIFFAIGILGVAIVAAIKNKEVFGF